ncbi:MAG: hypothetical protein JO331_07185 [Verrucomicrobia bacterium]|nr:hypothetical protein [Verrucomicrobiota bacterium]
MCRSYRRTTREEELAKLSNPKADGFADQLQHCAESEGPDHSVQSATQQRSLDGLQWGLIPYC